ncbi:MAG TPA: phosphatidylglycerol lysyltransferase domain-containing protein, partial [Bacillota bacterium]|nr:phosphatidylglycerol lysyltransferase domain-containing protein [Bacillota bacterium]
MTTPGQLDFRTPIISDRTWILPILRKYGNFGSESAFGTLFIWCERLLHKVYYTSDTLFIAFGIDKPSYQLPLGPLPLGESLDRLIQDATSRGHDFRLWGLDAEQMAAVESAMPGVFDYALDRDGADYIYTTEQMITLAGRKLHRKRNHLRRFNRQYRYEYEPISSENLLECQQFVIDWLFA